MEQLVARHHDEQKLIARNVVAALYPVWEILDFHDLKRTTAPWLKVARPIVEKGYLTSQYVAAEFVKNYRSAAYPGAEALAVELPNPLGALTTPQIPDRQVSIRILASLRVTGPIWLSSQSQPGMSTDAIPQMMRDGFSKSTGAVTRLVLNGGRGMVRTLAGADPLARGVVGIADSDACQGCQFLTRPIMKSAGARKMNAVAVGHDFCTCSAKPVY